MKIEDSGMPDESYWNSFFDINEIIEWLDIPNGSNIVEVGCGYGTFTLPIAKISSKNQIIVFDIEAEMINNIESKIKKFSLNNIQCYLGDVMTNGTGLETESVDFVLLFNILHCQDRHVLLNEAYRILNPNGIVAILHWRKDIPTPRGPKIETRPDALQIRQATNDLNFVEQDEKNLGPFHWGIKLKKSP